MKKTLILLLALFPAAAIAAEQNGTIFKQPLSPRIASYSIRVELDAREHRLVASERILWRNTTGQAASDAAFHLYLNAFMNSRSLFLTEARSNWPWLKLDEKSWGYCRVGQIYQVEGSQKFPLKQEFPAGDDRTVMRVDLARPVPPGGEASFELAFDCQLPQVVARSGYAGTYHLVAQWFPKLGVFEEGKGWNCHPYHANSEFFADFGTYDVEITLPREYIVGASGVEVGRSASGRKKTLRFRAEDIHDFAWAASPDFKIVEERWEGSGREVRLIFLMQPGNLGRVDRYITSLKGAMSWLSDKIYPYPYPQVTVVDPANNALFSGGMEYEMFFTAGLSPAFPRSFRWPEMTVIHEFCHSYWSGMSASNESEEAWLDEGLASYCENRISEFLYGEKATLIDGFLGFRFSSTRRQRLSYIGVETLDPIVAKAWDFSSGGTYAAMSYAKADLVLQTLEKRVGRPKMDLFLKQFFATAKFTHPTTVDFLKGCSEIFGNWSEAFLRPMLYGTATVDFSVAWVKQGPLTVDTGYFEKNGRLFSAGEKTGNARKGAQKGGEKMYSEILIRRDGELLLPVEVLVRFVNGTKKLETWDGAGRWKKFSYTGARVSSVEVDPANRLPIEMRKLNNTWSDRPEGLPARSLVGRARTAFQGFMTMMFNIL